jgi:putative acetyltransferase
MLFPEVLPLRQASRELVRELGFLQPDFKEAGLPHSQTHALLEIERHKRLPQRRLASLLRLDKSTTSRVVHALLQRGWAQAAPDAGDARVRAVSLTAAGRAKVGEIHRLSNDRVQRALALLGPNQRQTVLDGMAHYARALGRSRAQSELEVRPIRRADNPAVARLIRTVMPEFGASGPGFAIMDPEVDDMFGAYRAPRGAYFVVTRRGDDGLVVVGGAGVAPLHGGDDDVCELRKMYFLAEIRGLGMGQALMDRCLEAARKAGFRRCYLETLQVMERARALYARNGFRPLPRPLGATGHFRCDAFYLREL